MMHSDDSEARPGRTPGNESPHETPWIETVPEDEADGELVNCYRRLGHPIAHILLSISVNPAVLRTHYALYRAIMFGPSPLTRTQREVVATVVSLLNQCHRRIHHHGEALRQVQRGDPTLLRALVDGFRSAPVSPAERVMLQYVEWMTSEPRSIAESDVRSLRVGGWDDRAIHDMSQVISYFNYLNRLADGLGVSPEAEWSPSWPD